MYAIKNEAEDQLFAERTRLIRRTKPHEIMAYLGISKKFILGASSDPSDTLSASGIRPSYAESG